MSDYIELLAEPIFGVPYELLSEADEDDWAIPEILVSARLREEAEPYAKITHINPYESVRTIMSTTKGLLFIEARNPQDLADGTIAHMVLSVDQGQASILEAEVDYGYRYNRIADAMFALGWKLTGDPMDYVPIDAFKRL